MTPEDLVAATSAPINGLGARFYFDPATLERGKAAGLDGFRFYVLGRGGVLGDPDPSVVSSAFGYFNPALLAKMWTTGRETMAPADAAGLYLDCNADLGRANLSDVDGLDAFCDAAEQVVADLDPSGLTLYAATAAMPLPEDAPARALQQLVVHRELRGSIHLAAVIGHGMSAPVAHVLRRPGDAEMFGWGDGVDVPEGSEALLAQIDQVTDAVTANAYRSLSDDQRQAFVDGVTAISAAFGG